MYVVIQSPFPEFPKARKDSHVLLVKENILRPRILVQGFSRGEIARNEQVEWFETVAELLNTMPRAYVRLMLRSIRETWQDLITISEVNQSPQKVEPFFRADFGRRDFSTPGQGGSGVDGYW